MEKVALALILPFACSFYTRHTPSAVSRTHETITDVGILQALSTYIHKNKLNHVGSDVSSITDFYKDDAYSSTQMAKAILAVIQSITDTQVDKYDDAFVHCHADQIDLAHSYVISCRENLKQLKTDIAEMRRQIGKCLYTVQSFYSNTNWVEMYGNVPYVEFGVKGKKLMSVAAVDENTCVDVQSIERDCKDNILVKDKLTSGYYHGRGNIKPSKPPGSKHGKCSHGGPNDKSRELIAKCGINKDTSVEELSPHYHLHFDAYVAAVEATNDFLIGEGTGILQDIGNDVFDDLFHIKVRQDRSLAFVIDYSGSMSEDISGVRKTVKNYVTSTIGSDNEPAEYILSLFNDPITLNQVFVFQNGYDFIAKLESVTVDGGGDCPEYASDGILKAIHVCRNDSQMFVFTDADAKDKDRRSEVEAAARAKRIIISTFKSGNCSRTRRSAYHIRRRNVITFFLSLAQTTGGKVYETAKAYIHTVLQEVLEEVFPTAEILIDSFFWSTAEAAKKYFAVDSTVTLLKVAVFGSAGIEEVLVHYPNGSLVTYKTGIATKITTRKEDVIISIQKPPSGIFSLRTNIPGKWKINITAQSSISIDSEILETSNYYVVKGSPIIGYNYSYAVNVYNLKENGTCDKIFITDLMGDILSVRPAIQMTTAITTRCSCEFETPKAEFHLRINGTDINGREFSRKLTRLFRPTNVQLSVFTPEVIVVGKEATICYTLTNTGTLNDTYEVKIGDDHSYLLLPVTRKHTIDSGETVDGIFTLHPTSSSVIVKVIIKVYAVSESTTEIQSVTRGLLVSAIEHPLCTTLMVSGRCNDTFINTWDCVKRRWSAHLEITFSGTQIEGITSDVGPAVIINHQNITKLSSGPVNVSVSGTCCTPTTIINVVDLDGYITQCKLDFSDDTGTVISMDPNEAEKTKPSTQDKSGNGHDKIVIALIVLSVVVVLLLGIFGYIVYRKSKRYTNYNVTDTDGRVTYHSVKTNDGPDAKAENT